MTKTSQIRGLARPLALAALTAAVAGALALPQQARASAFQLKENSAKALGRAFAGSAAAGDDASVVVNNPAAMSLLKGTTFQADVTAVNFSAKFSGDAYDYAGRPVSGGNGGDAGTTLPIPAFFIASQVSDRVHLGFGLSAPFGFQTDYQHGWKGRYQALRSKFQSLDATLSASFDVTDNFALGLSAIAQRTSAELTSAINFNAVGMGLVQQGVAAGAFTPAQGQALAAQVGALVPPGTDGEARIKGDDWAYGWQVGGLWKLTDNDRLALDYRAKISHTLEGTANFSVPPAVQALLSNPSVAPLLAASGGVPFTHTTGNAPFSTPAVATASYWHQGQRFGFGMDLSWTKWDEFKNLTVRYGNPAQPDTVQKFNWRNSWFASVGGEYYATDKLTVRYGVAVDSSPTHADTRDARVPDSTRKWITFGLGYRPSDKLELNLGLAHIFVNKAHVNETDSTGDRLVGSFDDSGNLLSLSAAYHF
ncbi:outer membrane protein transport protein [Oleiagrimonas sp. C23AA]|uniref:OmpP1/FadL family transporter n=1 Tax=Oleiagrimonas sp. C23AA TaxID=2719047 RepID=UPI0014237104|nr:outer membrane protein transport protein [Oleiagrimonas sp. C23AA]NII11360.1 transporter [Oleiagrimonas sp. C23AA]